MFKKTLNAARAKNAAFFLNRADGSARANAGRLSFFFPISPNINTGANAGADAIVGDTSVSTSAGGSTSGLDAAADAGAEACVGSDCK